MKFLLWGYLTGLCLSVTAKAIEPTTKEKRTFKMAAKKSCDFKLRPFYLKLRIFYMKRSMLIAILNFPMDRMAPTVVLKSVLFIYRCDICSATFNLQKNLALHVAAHQTENLICPGEHFTGRVYTHNTYRYLLLIQSNYAFADRLIFSKVGIKILLRDLNFWK